MKNGTNYIIKTNGVSSSSIESKYPLTYNEIPNGIKVLSTTETGEFVEGVGNVTSIKTVWKILKISDPATAPFGLSNEDLSQIWGHQYGVASSESQTTDPMDFTDLSIWYLEGGTSHLDATWVEKGFVTGQMILNVNQGLYDYMHTFPELPSTNWDYSNYPAGLYVLESDNSDGYLWRMQVVKQYPDPSYNKSSFLQYDSINKVFTWLDADLLTAKPIGPAGGDLYGSYPNPRIKEITGVPAMLTPSIAFFDWKSSGGWAAGAGIGFGYGYVNGVRSKVWMAISQLGELHISYDEWKSTVYVDPANAYYGSFVKPDNITIQPYNDVQSKFSGRYAAVTYVKIPGTNKFCWMFGAEYKLMGLEDIPENYNVNGSIKIENIFQWTYSGGDPNTINSNGDVLVITGNMSKIQYAEAVDIDWANKNITFHDASVTGTNSTNIGVYGGNGCDGSSFMSVGRDSGIVVKSSDGKVWTVADVLSNKFQDGSEIIKTSTGEYSNALPMRTTNPSTPSWSANDNCWGGVLYANGMWIVVNGKVAPTVANNAWSPFMFTYDQSNWNGYKPTPDELAVNYTYTMYKIAYGYGKTFATNADPMQVYGTQPSIYRLLVDEIPVHRNIVAEKGIFVLGDTYLADYPNATRLGTDENGKIITNYDTSSSSKKYYRGNTEVIRGTSSEVMAFAVTFDNIDTSGWADNEIIELEFTTMMRPIELNGVTTNNVVNSMHSRWVTCLFENTLSENYALYQVHCNMIDRVTTEDINIGTKSYNIQMNLELVAGVIYVRKCEISIPYYVSTTGVPTKAGVMVFDYSMGSGEKPYTSTSISGFGSLLNGSFDHITIGVNLDWLLEIASTTCTDYASNYQSDNSIATILEVNRIKKGA